MAQPNLIIKKPSGGINTDTNPNDIPPQSMLGALDITDINHGELNEDGFTQLNNNTELAFDICPNKAIMISKTYRLRFDIPSEDFNITINVIHRDNTWNIPITTACVAPSPPLPLTSNDVYNFINPNFTANYDNLYDGFQHSFYDVIEGDGFLQFDMLFVNFLFDDYFIEVTMTSIADPTKEFAYQLNVISDAISLDKEGYLKPIEIVSLGSKMFVFSTVECPDVSEIADYNGIESVDIESSGTSYPLLTIDGNVGDFSSILPTNTEVKVFSDGTTNLSGTYIVDTITLGGDDYTILQNLFNPPAPLYFNAQNGTLKLSTRTLSAIGVAEKNESTGVWTYIELLRSTNLNFRTNKPIQAKVSQTDFGYIFNWTDFNENPRRLTYQGEFVEGGFLEVYNPLNKYNLDNIDQESQLIVVNNLARIKLGNSLDIDNIGTEITGVKPAATYQAFVRFATEDGQYGVFSPPSNTTTIYNIRPSGYWQPQVAGGISGQSALIIDISNIRKGLYKYFQVAIVEMTGSSFNAYALQQQTLNDEDETIRVIDTGRRQSDYVLLDRALINELQFTITAAKSIEDYDNRIEFANVKLQNRYDLTEWAKTIDVTYEQIAREELYIPVEGGDIYRNQYNYWFDIKYCKWLSDEYLSYAPFETVRWAIMVWFKDGGTPLTFHIGDYRVDPSNSEDPENPLKLDMSNTSNEPLQIIANFKNINLNYQLPTGEILWDIVEDFRFCRADIPQEMLWSGVALSGDALLTSFTNLIYINRRYDNSGTANVAIQRDRFFTYVPDFINNGYTNVFRDGDKAYFIEPSFQTGGASPFFEYADYYGNNQNADMDWEAGVDVTNISDTSSNVLVDTKYYELFTPASALTPNSALQGRYTRTMTLDDDIPTPIANSRELFNFYYVREIAGDKYGGIYSTPFYIITSDYFDRKTHNASTKYKAYSGNMFIQKSYYTIQQTVGATSTALYLLQKVVGFYSMNRFNSQLRNGIFLQYDRFFYPDPTIKNILSDTYTYDKAFNPRYIFQNQLIFNPNLKYLEREKASIYWSEKAIDNGTFGANRIFRPLNKKALELRDGEITHIETFNIENQTYLATWQPYQFTLQYFNNTGQLITENSQVLLGTGDVLGRNGADVTRYGCSHKWSIVKGVNPQGKPVMYWYSANERHLMRMGADGLSNISLSAGFETFLNKYCLLNDVSNIEDTPTRFYGVHGVWNDLKKQYILTFRGIRKHTIWDGETPYAKGEWVTDETTFGFEGIPVLYRCKVANTGESLSDTDFWEKFDYYNRESISFFTIVWDEYSNSLKTELSHIPMIYGEYKNTFVSGSPSLDTNKYSPSYIYEHNKDNQARYYCSPPTTYFDNLSNDITVSYLGKNVEVDGVLVKGYVFETSYPVTSFLAVPSLPSDMQYLLDEHKSIYLVPLSDRLKHYRIAKFLTTTIFVIDEQEDLVWNEDDDLFFVSQCNTGQPFFEQVVNEPKGTYSFFGHIAMFSDTTIKRVEFEAGLDSLGQKTTQSFLNEEEFEYFNGTLNSQIKNDTTNNPTNNNVGKNLVQGYWMKVKALFKLNIKNKIHKYSVKAQPLQRILK
jgi:hypothetical protein